MNSAVHYKRLIKSVEKTKWEDQFRMLCKWMGLAVPVEQYRFDPHRRWKVDFAWPAFRVGVEIEGGIWRRGGGGHSHPLHIERDLEKNNAALLLGWRMFRITGKMLRSKAVDAKKLLESPMFWNPHGPRLPMIDNQEEMQNAR